MEKLKRRQILKQKNEGKENREKEKQKSIAGKKNLNKNHVIYKIAICSILKVVDEFYFLFL